MINILGHFANILYALGFLIKDLLGLRLVMTFAITMEILYSFYVAENPLWTNIIWCFVYLAVNGWQIIFLLLEKRTITLQGDEKKIYDKIFSNLPVKEFIKLLNAGRFSEYPENTVLATENEMIDRLILLINGNCEINVLSKKIADISDYTFIGEMGFLTNDPASATVKTESYCRCFEWDKTALHNLMNGDSAINVNMQAVFASDIITKLKKQNREVLVKMCSI
ncbi:MAG: cyclic nucleotide-binding domain-containing protein [Spirochaetes bacterium]|nr:cyclic nucleotide-binding domain-containing protein [Spirochaetota bacterium]